MLKFEKADKQEVTKRSGYGHQYHCMTEKMMFSGKLVNVGETVTY